jgi:Flp pilus assembly protein TadG
MIRFRRDQRGAAAIEFAFIAPILILFYVGMAELCQALMAERKASHTASAVADLIAQVDETTPAGVAGVLDISEQVLQPFPGGENLEIRVSSVVVDANNVAKVAWSEGRHMSERGVGEVVALPKVSDGSGGERNFIAAGESVIMAEVNYAFETEFSDLFAEVQKFALGSASIHTGGYTFSSTYYLRPRRSEQVSCPTC